MMLPRLGGLERNAQRNGGRGVLFRIAAAIPASLTPTQVPRPAGSIGYVIVRPPTRCQAGASASALVRRSSRLLTSLNPPSPRGTIVTVHMPLDLTLTPASRARSPDLWERPSPAGAAARP